MSTVQATPGPKGSVVISITSDDGKYSYVVLTEERWEIVKRDGDAALKRSKELS